MCKHAPRSEEDAGWPALPFSAYSLQTGSLRDPELDWWSASPATLLCPRHSAGIADLLHHTQLLIQVLVIGSQDLLSQQVPLDAKPFPLPWAVVFLNREKVKQGR